MSEEQPTKCETPPIQETTISLKEFLESAPPGKERGIRALLGIRRCRADAACHRQVVALFAVPFKHRLGWNKFRCQGAMRLTAANKTLASSESSQSVRSLPPLTPVLPPPYNVES